LDKTMGLGIFIYVYKAVPCGIDRMEEYILYMV